jgi:hypothetical protein
MKVLTRDATHYSTTVNARFGSFSTPTTSGKFVAITCAWGSCRQEITAASTKFMRVRLTAHFQDCHSDADLDDKKTNQKTCRWVDCRCSCHRSARCIEHCTGNAAHAAHICDLLSHLWKIHVESNIVAVEDTSITSIRSSVVDCYQ